MKFDTKHSIGDKVWVTVGQDHKNFPGLVTIGQVRVECTNSPGLPGEELFDNYKAQQGYEERYMCVETGVGSGTLWEPGLNLFDTEEECRAAIAKRGQG